MPETELTTAEASALDGTTDGETGFKYHSPGDASYYTEGQRQRQRLLTLAKAIGNRFRVYKDGADTFGVREGQVRVGDAVLSYAGSSANELTDDQTNYVYLYVDEGALTLGVSTTGFPDPSETPNVPLATVTVASGSYAYSDIVDCRQLACFSLGSAAGAAELNVLVGGSNADTLHTHDTAGLADGAVTDAKIASSLCKRPAVKAWGAVDFSGRPADDETLTIGGRIYEIDGDGDFPQSGGDVQVDTSGNASVDEDITDLAAAINGDGSASVSAYADTSGDILWLYAKTAGSAGNSTTVAEALSNAAARGSTLCDGADAAVCAVVSVRHTITAADAAAGRLRLETGLTSIEGLYLSFEDAGVHKASDVAVGIDGGTLTLDEGATAWAADDVLNILVTGTE